MGRIADALKKAERERRGVPADAASETAFPPVAAAPAHAPGHETAPAAAPQDSEAEQGKPLEVVEGVAEALVPYYDRSSLISEQYRALRTRLLSQNTNNEHRIIAITSAIPREGKSVTSLNMGCTFSEIRHLKVLVVDCDFRRSTLARMLQVSERPGLADVLAGAAEYEDVVRPTIIPNLFFIAAGSTHGRSPAELLTDIKARQLFRRMQDEFNYTIVDTPPATTVSDVGVIGQMSSGVIMIVRLNRTRETDAKRAVRLLQANNIPIMGSLIVGRDTVSSGYGYGYGYGYGRYYSRYYNDYYNSEREKQGAPAR